MANKPTAEYNIRSKDETKGGLQSASSSLDAFGKNVDSVFKNIAKITAVGMAAVTGVGVAFNKLTDIYGKQEKAEIQLAAAARNNPLLNGKSVVGLKEYASSLQKVSTFGDEAILPLMAMGEAMGYSEEMIKKVSSAAVDLAAGSGGTMSLEAAFKNLYKTLGGMTGELGESMPALRGLTEEQLKAGAAIDIVSKQYGGMASTIARSTSGIKEQTKNIFGDMLESMGKGLAPISNILMRKLQPVFNAIGKWFEENSSQITNFFLHFGEIARIVINRTGDGFKKMFTWDWAWNYVQIVMDGIRNILVSLIKFFLNLVIAIGTTVWLPLLKGFEWVGYGVRVAWQGVINGLASGIGWLIENPVDDLVVAFKTVVNAIGKAIQWILNGLIVLINGVIAGLNAIIEGAHNAQEMLKHPFDKSQRETFSGGISEVKPLDISWADPKLHEKITSSLKNWIVDLKNVPKPKDEWADISAKVKEVWENTADAGLDVLKASLQHAMDVGEIFAEPFKESFTGFSVEFKEILLRDLPPEAVSVFEEVLKEIEKSASEVKPTKWEIFIGYITTRLEALSNALKNSIPKIETGFEKFVGGLSNAIKAPGKALSSALNVIKEGVASAGLALIKNITGIDLVTGKKTEDGDGDDDSGQSLISKGLSSLWSYIMNLVSSTEVLMSAFEYLSESLKPMFETLVTPLVEGLMPILNVSIGFTEKIVAMVLPIIEELSSILQSLAEPLGILLDAVAGILQPIVGLLVDALKIVGDLLIQIMPVITTVVNAIGNILAPVISFISSLLQSLAPVFTLIGDVILALSPIIEAIGIMLGSFLGAILQPLADFIGIVLTPILAVLGSVLSILTPVFQIFANIMKSITPIFSLLNVILNVALIPLKLFSNLFAGLNPFVAWFAGLLEYANPVIEFFAKMLDAATRPIEFVGDLFEWLGEGIKALGEFIWYVITFQWNKLGDVDWPSAFESDAFNRPLIDLSDLTDSLTTPAFDPTAGGGSDDSGNGGYGGTGASYGVNSYTVNVTINTDAIAGPDGIRGLALLIEGELESLRGQGRV